MAAISLTYKGPVAVLKMQNGENRFIPEFFKQFFSALDEIESNDDIKVVVTIGEGKFYSNGLDLDGMARYTAEDFRQLASNVKKLTERILTFPMVTIAAINGHAFAAGGLLALMHDYRFMRKERGWFCLPEIKLERPFEIPTMELAKAKLPSTEYTNCILTGKRYTADEGHLCGIIHRVFPGDELLDSALTVALHLAKENFDRHTLKELKRGLYYPVLKAINDDIVFYAKL